MSAQDRLDVDAPAESERYSDSEARIASDIRYFTYPGASGSYFRCEPYRATMSKTACAARWQEAQQARGFAADRLEKCKACRLGAIHAGKPVVQYSSFYGKLVCPRCGKFAMRIIAGTRCVSCANRDYEFVKKKDAKGHVPGFVFHPRRLGLITDYGGSTQSYVELRSEHTRSAVELALAALRVVPGRMALCRPLGRSVVDAADLVAQHARSKNLVGAARRRRRAA